MEKRKSPFLRWAVGADVGVHRRVEIEQIVDDVEVNIPTALVGPLLALAAPYQRREIHRLEIDVHAGLPQLIHADRRHSRNIAVAGRCQHHDTFVAIARSLQPRTRAKFLATRAQKSPKTATTRGISSVVNSWEVHNARDGRDDDRRDHG